jgi:hypothetical protein
LAVAVACSRAAVPCSAADRQQTETADAEQSDGGRVAGWLADVDYLRKQIQSRHYTYKSQPLSAAFEAREKRIRESIGDYSDERMLAELAGLTKELGDGHSCVYPIGAKRVEAHCLPLEFYQFSDGLFVVGAASGYERLVGSRVLKFGPQSADQAMARMAEFVSRDNEMGVRWIGPFLLRFRGTWEAIGATPGAQLISLTFRNRDGKTHVEEVEFVAASQLAGAAPAKLAKLGPPPSSVCASPVPLYLSDVEKFYWFRELPDSHALYAQFNQIIDGPDETVGAFAKNLQQKIDDRPPRLLIVDVRHNNGGHAELAAPMVDLLERFESDHRGAKIALLTGRNTFSACQIFISEVNRGTKAIFAGEPSSSKPNFVGEENNFTLPYSGAIGSISNRYHETIPGDTRSWIEPEIKVDLSSADYFSNRDPVLAAVLNRFRDASASH